MLYRRFRGFVQTVQYRGGGGVWESAGQVDGGGGWLFCCHRAACLFAVNARLAFWLSRSRMLVCCQGFFTKAGVSESAGRGRGWGSVEHGGGMWGRFGALGRRAQADRRGGTKWGSVNLCPIQYTPPNITPPQGKGWHTQWTSRDSSLGDEHCWYEHSNAKAGYALVG